MTFLGSFGNKITSTVADYGKKETQLLNKGVKFAADNFTKAGRVAGTIGDVAGTAAGIAAMTGIGEPVAAVLGGVAGSAKLAQKGLSTAGTAAIGIDSARRAAAGLKRGDIAGAVRDAKMVAQAAKLTKKQIERK